MRTSPTALLVIIIVYINVNLLECRVKRIEDKLNNTGNRIEKQITDERGLTSVMFTQDGKQWGLDFLTKCQLDSLKLELLK